MPPFGWIAREQPILVTCDVARIELIRAFRRLAPHDLRSAHDLLAGMIVAPLTSGTYRSAADLDPVALRSLDAIHLAAAREFGDDLESILTYYQRQTEAAEALGIWVLAPR